MNNLIDTLAASSMNKQRYLCLQRNRTNKILVPLDFRVIYRMLYPDFTKSITLSVINWLNNKNFLYKNFDFMQISHYIGVRDAILVGTPGLYQKILVFNDEKQLVVKIAFIKSANSAIKSEKNVLRALDGNLGKSIKIPRLIFEGCFEDFEYIVIEFIDVSKYAKSELGLNELADVVSSLHMLDLTLDRIDYDIEYLLRQPISYKLSESLIEKIKEISLIYKRTPSVFSHGDFTKNNVFFLSGQFVILDWESAGYRSLYHDFFHYFFTLGQEKKAIEYLKKTVFDAEDLYVCYLYDQFCYYLHANVVNSKIGDDSMIKKLIMKLEEVII